MSRERRGGSERQLMSLDRRMQEIEAQSAAAARSLIAANGADRRSPRSTDLEREIQRLRRERQRLERERQTAQSAISEEELERHLRHVERQIQEVFEERDGWFRESLGGQRRRQEDFRALQRLKAESERLTAELLRCAAMLCQNRRATENPRLRRVWQMLRLSGT
ncbi:MAG: hypothetical protein ACREQQ_02615 [Candidatus Binatia bacterium]